MDTKSQLLVLLERIVPFSQYQAAEDVAGKENDENGSLDDLRALRLAVLVEIKSLADSIDRLHRDVKIYTQNTEQ